MKHEIESTVQFTGKVEMNAKPALGEAAVLVVWGVFGKQTLTSKGDVAVVHGFTVGDVFVPEEGTDLHDDLRRRMRLAAARHHQATLDVESTISDPAGILDDAREQLDDD